MKPQKHLTLDQYILKKIKKHKKHNLKITLITLGVLILLLILLTTVSDNTQLQSLEETKDKTNMIYAGNIHLTSNIKKNSMNDTFKSILTPLNESDYTTANLHMDRNSSENVNSTNEIMDNLQFFHDSKFKSINTVNNNLSYKQIKNIDKKAENRFGYNYLTGGGSNSINSKVVQQQVGNKRVATVSFIDINSQFIDGNKELTSISLKPDIFMPLIQNLKKNNDYVVVYVNWGIPNERQVTSRQKAYAHALADAGADIIIGNNNVIQEMENYKKTNIFYSLGNLTSEGFLTQNKRGLIVEQSNYKGNEEFKIIPTRFKNGKVVKEKLNKLEEIKFINNFAPKDIKLVKENGGYTYETKK